MVYEIKVMNLVLLTSNILVATMEVFISVSSFFNFPFRGLLASSNIEDFAEQIKKEKDKLNKEVTKILVEDKVFILLIAVSLKDVFFLLTNDFNLT